MNTCVYKQKGVIPAEEMCWGGGGSWRLLWGVFVLGLRRRGTPAETAVNGESEEENL